MPSAIRREHRWYRDNNVPFVLEVENTPIEELKHSIAVYINNTPEWISVERGKNYEVGAQYDGIIENHTGKKIKDWKLAVYLPRKGVLDSYWNGTFQVVNDCIEIMPMDYNREIEDGFVYGIHHYDEDDKEINNLGDVLETM